MNAVHYPAMYQNFIGRPEEGKYMNGFLHVSGCMQASEQTTPKQFEQSEPNIPSTMDKLTQSIDVARGNMIMSSNIPDTLKEIRSKPLDERHVVKTNKSKEALLIYKAVKEPRVIFHNLRSNSIADSSYCYHCGVHVNMKFFKTPEMVYRDEDNIVKLCNTEVDEELSYRRMKDIHSNIIPRCVRSVDIVSLSKLLECHFGVEIRVTNCIRALLFETNVLTYDPEHTRQCVDIFLCLMKKCTGSKETTSNVLSLTLMLLAVQYLQSLTHYDGHDIKVALQQRCKFYQKKMAEIKVACTFSNITESLHSQVNLALEYTCSENAPEAHCLNLYNWSAVFSDKKRLDDLHTEMKNMSYFEQYSFLLRIMIQMHRHPTEHIAEFLTKCSQSLLNLYSKKNQRIEMYPLMDMIATGVVHMLDSHIYQETECERRRHRINGCMCEILCCIYNAYVNRSKSKKTSEMQEHLSRVMTKLLFHKEKSVVDKLTSFLAGEIQEQEMFDKTIEYISAETLPICFEPDLQQMEPQLKPPLWTKQTGRISGHLNVSMFILVPSLKHLQHGAFNVKNLLITAKDKFRIQHLQHVNTLEKLRHFDDADSHTFVAQLIAFQLFPMPCMFITEKLEENLCEFLHRSRRHCSWFGLNELALFVVDILNSLEYIHGKGVLHRNITASAFKVRDGSASKKIVMFDFGLARFVHDSTGSCCINNIQNEIPTRWSALESHWEGSFNFQTDIWMLGMVVYEIFSHGCWPFTELYGKNLDDVIEKVVIHDLKPHKLACIPLEIHKIISDCTMTDPADRPTTREIMEQLQTYLSSETSKRGTLGMRNVFAESVSDPPALCQEQLKNNHVERGVPISLLQMQSVSEAVDPYACRLYLNVQKAQRKFELQENIRVKEIDLLSADQPLVRETDIGLVIQEPVYQEFIDKCFHSLKEETEMNKMLMIMDWPPEKHSRYLVDEKGLTYNLKYMCVKGKRLSEIALTQMYGASSNPMYLNILYQAAVFLEKVHKSGWIMGDICCSMLFLYTSTNSNIQVFMPRLGRMMRLATDTCCIKRFDVVDYSSRQNWLPLEVLRDKELSVYSDVYMFAMAVYEFYKTLDMGTSKVVSSQLETVPFWDVPKEELLENLEKGNQPEKPSCCPDWMYDLLQHCWNRDFTKRPSAAKIRKELQIRISKLPMNGSYPDCMLQTQATDEISVDLSETSLWVSSISSQFDDRSPSVSCINSYEVSGVSCANTNKSPSSNQYEQLPSSVDIRREVTVSNIFDKVNQNDDVFSVRQTSLSSANTSLLFDSMSTESDISSVSYGNSSEIPYANSHISSNSSQCKKRYPENDIQAENYVNHNLNFKSTCSDTTESFDRNMLEKVTLDSCFARSPRVEHVNKDAPEINIEKEYAVRNTDTHSRICAQTTCNFHNFDENENEYEVREMSTDNLDQNKTSDHRRMIEGEYHYTFSNSEIYTENAYSYAKVQIPCIETRSEGFEDTGMISGEEIKMMTETVEHTSSFRRSCTTRRAARPKKGKFKNV